MCIVETPTITLSEAILSDRLNFVSTAADSPIYLNLPADEAFHTLHDICGCVNALLNTETFDSLLTRAAEVIERHSVLFRVNRILKSIL